MSHQYGLYAASVLAAAGCAAAVYTAKTPSEKIIVDKLEMQKLEKRMAQKIEKRIVQKLEKRIAQKQEKLIAQMQTNQNTLTAKIKNTGREIATLAGQCNELQREQVVNNNEVESNLISMTGKIANAVRHTELLHQELTRVKDAYIHYIEGGDSDDSDQQQDEAAPAGDLDEDQLEATPVAETIKSREGE
jgi:uncharacterized protein HemX